MKLRTDLVSLRGAHARQVVEDRSGERGFAAAVELMQPTTTIEQRLVDSSIRISFDLMLRLANGHGARSDRILGAPRRLAFTVQARASDSERRCPPPPTRHLGMHHTSKLTNVSMNEAR